MARQGLRIHPKFKRLIALLRMPEAHVLGHLQMLWESSYELGDVLGDASDVEMTAGWVGEPGVLCAALEACGGIRKGFVEEIPGSSGVFKVHDLYDHAPQYVQKRMEREADRIQKNTTISGIRRAAANNRWGKDIVNSEIKEEECKQIQIDNVCIPVSANGCTPSPSPSTTTPLPPEGASKGKRPKREPKAEEIGNYPPELREAIPLWREMLKYLKSDEARELVPRDKVWVADSVGTAGATWSAWQKRTAQTIQGQRIQDVDVLEALKLFRDSNIQKARAGQCLVGKMLPSMINHADFNDALERAVASRTKAEEVPNAS